VQRGTTAVTALVACPSNDIQRVDDLAAVGHAPPLT
jgi:hypothetical protein